MTKKQFAKSIIIYKSHRLKNNFISISYATILGSNAVSTEKTIKIENKGGALTSMFLQYCN